MKNFKLIVFPSYVTALVKSGDVNASELMDMENWTNIFSRSTVRKIKELNSFTGGGATSNYGVLNTLGLKWLTAYAEPLAQLPNNFNILTTLMSDGRESEVDLILNQLHNFRASFDFVRAGDGTYLVLLEDLQPIDDMSNRYVELRSNMGKLIDDMSSMINHDDIVCEPIVQSYMINNI